MSAHALPYEGLRVLDMSQGIAGPYCAGLLAMQGAEVVKIEPPGGDWIRAVGGGREGLTALTIMGNLGKRSACIDVAKPAGRDLVLGMARKADVFVQNLRPGVIERLGFGYDTLAKDNPALVYLSITGFGPRGPDAKRAGTDSVLQAYTGMAHLNRDADGIPRRIPFLVPDTTTAVYAAQAVGAALFARHKSGRGRHVEVSLMAACAALQAGPIIDDSLTGGKPVPALTVPAGIFRTRNGYMTVTSLNETTFAALMKVLGLESLCLDPRFAQPAERQKNAALVNAEVARRLATEDTAHWLRGFGAVDVLCAEAVNFAGFRASPQAAEMGVFETLDQFPYGPLQIPRVPGGSSDWPLAPAPRVGEHTLEVLAESGLSAVECAALIDSGIAMQAV
jgi:crotonobetainyl-CoA:carnitine CoA-transferase CaiB-like acyl-CoA transferase